MRFSTNPLPGMNPWLETYWGDVHTRLTTYSCDQIQKLLPRDLQARVEEYLSVHESEEEGPSDRRISPDVSVIEQPGLLQDGDSSSAARMIVSEEPVRVRRLRPPQTLRYIKIVDTKGHRRVVTVIEFISLANKATQAGRKQYFTKQNELLEAGVNLVEIDLLRAGGWVMATQQDLYPPTLKHPYRVGVVRAENILEAEIYPATFASPLPTIRIPLRVTDADVLLPLQPLVDQSYENGRYGNDIDYTQPPEPPLAEPEQQWIIQFLAQRQATTIHSPSL